MLALETALESWLPRAETAVASLLELTMKRVKQLLVGVQRVDEGVGAVERRAEVLVGLVRLAGRPRRRSAALPLMNSPSPRRTLGGKVLKSWSMSTGVVVEARPRVAPSSSAGLLLGPGLIET